MTARSRRLAPLSSSSRNNSFAATKHARSAGLMYSSGVPSARIGSVTDSRRLCSRGGLARLSERLSGRVSSNFGGVQWHRVLRWRRGCASVLPRRRGCCCRCKKKMELDGEGPLLSSNVMRQASFPSGTAGGRWGIQQPASRALHSRGRRLTARATLSMIVGAIVRPEECWPG